MNQESLQSYKNQVYNPGSPNPNPNRSPLKSLPKTQNFPYTSSVNPENPLKITLSTCKRKRISSSSSPETPSSLAKKPKMNKEEVKELTEDLLARFIAAQDKSSKELKEAQENATKELKVEIGTVQGKIEQLSEKQEKTSNEIKKDREETDARFKTLEAQVASLETRQHASHSNVDKDSIQAVVQDYVDNSSDNSWKANLAQEVFNHDHGLVVHGIRVEGTDDATKKAAAIKFIREELKASEDTLSKVKIKEVIRLGTDTGAGKPPPVLIKFGHPTERNLLLPLSRNLRRGVDIDKNIPKSYQSKHKEFKRLAWKLKTIHDVKTQVIFDSFNLILRYKKPDDGITKYNWIIEREFYPKPSDIVSVQNRATARDPNKLDSPVIDTSSVAECHRTIIVTGVCESIDQTNVVSHFMTYFKDNQSHIERVTLKSKGTVVVTCPCWTSCKMITDTYEKVKLFNKDLVFTLFSETDPSN